jgi:DNA-binding NtrC family response regulator
VSLPHPALSRFHARFVRSGASVVVEDLSSRHGTWIAGKRIQRAELELGSAVRLADVVIAVIPGHLSEPASQLRKHGAPEALFLGLRMRELRERLHRIAQTDLPVVLLGETGTGKELAAREVHLASRRKGPLRALNCAAIPLHLVESTLFGHERGAFTGADRTRAGAFEDAQGGTLFLDEIGELSLAAQATLLRVLETRRVSRVGSNREIEVNARIVCATHRDLGAMAARGELRLDLFHRLSVIVLELPPLRERREEIAPLAQHFLSQCAGVRQIDHAALSCMEQYDWPGNVRELRNVIARASALATGACITARDLPEMTVSHRREAQGDDALPLPTPQPATAEAPLRTRLKSIERDAVLRALQQAGGHQRRAAALLGVPLRTFERRVRAVRDESAD